MDRRSFLLAGGAGLLLPGCVRVSNGEPDPAPLPADAPPSAWQKLPTVPYRGKQDDIAFGSSRRGWYGNGEGRLYRTDNGGDAWEQVWHQPGTFVRALGFLDEEVGVLGNVGVGAFPNVTDTVPLYRTADGGRSWTPARIIGPTPSGICGIDIFRFGSIDRGTLASRAIVHAAGRVGGPAHYLRSTDGGQSWTSRDLSALTAAIFDVKFLSERVGFIAGTSATNLTEANGLILRTDDGGDTWRPVYRSARPFETVWKLHFPTGRAGFGSVQNYDPDPANAERFVVATSDGGQTWRELPLIANHAWRSFAIGFSDVNRGWVGGIAGGLETRDAGRTWVPVEMGRAVNKIRFVGAGRARRAFAIGSDVHRLELG